MATGSDRSRVAALRPIDERSAGVQRLLAQFRPRLAEPMQSQELRAEAIVALAFLIVAVPLAALGAAHGSRSLVVVLVFVVVMMALTSALDLGFGKLALWAFGGQSNG